ncbi:MAG: HAMP domain-containing histidine kinase [Chloroflexi bacterium]|nr:HAMP domain-containing histidine kinase [Chloroflexota bacterium]
MNQPATADFAPDERSTEEEIRRQRELFLTPGHFMDFLNFMPDIVMVLNVNREIVFANNTALAAFAQAETGKDHPYGCRVGEALRCENSTRPPDGCGTSVFCRYCGAVKTILASLKGEQAVEECRITQEHTGHSMAFVARSFPFQVSGEKFSIFVLRDVTSERRMYMLERVFLHDTTNLLTAVRGWTSLLTSAKTIDEVREIASTLTELSDELSDEFTGQKQFVDAEKHELTLDISEVNSREVLQSIKHFFENHSIYSERKIRIDPTAVPVVFSTDGSLLRRVLGNMVKNAMEAIKPGEMVTMGCAVSDQQVEFHVHNPGVIPLESQFQIFNLSFSTKGRDRGLGTYSMKLLSERYLKGKVGFTSSDRDGTTFIATYPLSY